jgi:tetratricopeptide (TPR) repeat protein
MTTNFAFQQSVNHDNSEDLTASLQTVIELYPDHAPAHHDLGGAYYQKGDNDNALVHYEKAVEIDPENTVFKKSLADFYYTAAGRVDDALEMYGKVLEQQPRNLEALLMAGHISVTLEKFDDAEEYYKRVLEIEPSDPIESMKILQKVQVTQQLPIEQVELYGALLHVVAPKIEQSQVEIEQILKQAGIQIRSMAVIEPSLEDVFISSMK